MQEPIIRRARPDEAEIVAAIGARTFSETFGHLYPADELAVFLAEVYDVERARADLADPAKATWLVEVDGEVVGHALVGPCALPHSEVTPACGELKRLYLLKPWQNGGTGRRLFAQAIDWLLADGPRDLWIGVWSENHGARRFYERHGFVRAGEYGFQVGSTTDREFILHRPAHGSAS